MKVNITPTPVNTTPANTNAPTRADAIADEVAASFDAAQRTAAEATAEAKRPRTRKADDADAEIEALRTCSRALEGLADDARSRVLLYLSRRHEPAWSVSGYPGRAPSTPPADLVPRTAGNPTGEDVY